jgi:Cu2+-containing amine oxidase
MVLNETSRQWNPLAFTSLGIHDSTLKNSQMHASGYDLMPLRTGTPRHQEDYTKSDFWITRYKFTEMHVPSLPTYIAPAEPVSSNDVVVWYYSAAHHMPRDEDGRYVSNSFQPTVAQVMWTGFMLNRMTYSTARRSILKQHSLAHRDLPARCGARYLPCDSDLCVVQHFGLHP